MRTEGDLDRVFLSYSSKDKPWADAACAVIESRGVRCWLAPRDVSPGAEWGAEIVAGIDTCRLMVLIFSDHANQSPQVRREVERAVSKGLTIIPCRVEDVKPVGSLEYALSNTHWLDVFTPPVEKQFDRLATAVQRVLAAERERVGESGVRQGAAAEPAARLFRFACPACGKRLKATAEQAGKKARCSCGQSVTIPSPALGRLEGDSAAALPTHKAAGPRVPPPPPPSGQVASGRPRSRLPLIAGAAGVLVLAVVGVLVASLALGGRGKTPSNNTPVASNPTATAAQNSGPPPTGLSESASKSVPPAAATSEKPPAPKKSDPVTPGVPGDVHGTWAIKEFWLDGAAKPADQIEGLDVAVDDESIVFEFATSFLQQKYRIDPKANPPELDLVFPDGKKMQGIYSAGDDKLRICLGADARPKAFAAQKGETGSMEFYCQRSSKPPAVKPELFPVRPGQKPEIEEVRFLSANQTHGSLKFEMRVRPGAEPVDFNSSHGLWYCLGSPSGATFAEVLAKQIKDTPGLLLNFTGPGYAAGPCTLLRRSTDDPNVWVGKALLGEVDFTGAELNLRTAGGGANYAMSAVPVSWVILEPKSQVAGDYTAIVDFPRKTLRKAPAKKGAASPTPNASKTGPGDPAITYEMVVKDPQKYSGKRVVWPGEAQTGSGTEAAFAINAGEVNDARKYKMYAVRFAAEKETGDAFLAGRGKMTGTVAGTLTISYEVSGSGGVGKETRKESVPLLVDVQFVPDKK
jgi:uncharacterized protein (TIGR03067 family)